MASGAQSTQPFESKPVILSPKHKDYKQVLAFKPNPVSPFDPFVSVKYQHRERKKWFEDVPLSCIEEPALTPILREFESKKPVEFSVWKNGPSTAENRDNTLDLLYSQLDSYGYRRPPLDRIPDDMPEFSDRARTHLNNPPASPFAAPVAQPVNDDQTKKEDKEDEEDEDEEEGDENDGDEEKEDQVVH
ncbi:hypothetical protein JCM5350_003558 [Sporobolomyces pararoseus]